MEVGSSGRGAGAFAGSGRAAGRRNEPPAAVAIGVRAAAGGLYASMWASQQAEIEEEARVAASKSNLGIFSEVET